MPELDFARWTTAAGGLLTFDRFRIAAICSTIALATSGIGALVYLQDSHVRRAGSGLDALAASSRLPRARPDEPLVTGSVRPTGATARQRDPASPRASRGRALGTDLAELQDKAVLTARSWSECEDAVAADVLESRASPSGRVVFRIDCGNGTRFYIDQDETALDRPATAGQREAALSDPEAIGVCEEKLKRGLAMPTSFQRLLPSTGVSHAASGDAVVTFKFDALNGLGFPITMQAECRLVERRIARLEITPR